MKRISRLLAILLAGVLGSTQSPAQNAYITNSGSNNVSVINTRNNKVIATVPVDGSPGSATVTPDGSKVYVATSAPNGVVVIDTATNTVITTIPVGGSLGPATVT